MECGKYVLDRPILTYPITLTYFELANQFAYKPSIVEKQPIAIFANVVSCGRCGEYCPRLKRRYARPKYAVWCTYLGTRIHHHIVFEAVKGRNGDGGVILQARALVYHESPWNAYNARLVPFSNTSWIRAERLSTEDGVHMGIVMAHQASLRLIIRTNSHEYSSTVTRSKDDSELWKDQEIRPRPPRLHDQALRERPASLVL